MNDILVTALLGYGPKDAYKPQAGPVYLWAFGQKMSFGSFKSSGPAQYRSTPKGGSVSTSSQCLAVDFSGASGAPAVLALAGIEAPTAGGNVSVTPVEVAGQKVTIVTIQEGNAPRVSVADGKIAVGGQMLTVDGRQISFAK